MKTLDASLDLFSGFDPDTIARLTAAAEKPEQGQARAIRQKHRHKARRATAESHLAEILPKVFEPGESWHVISHGDIDSLSYLIHAISGYGYFDLVALSTWCMAKNDVDQIAEWLDSGRIESIEVYAGEIFPSQYPAEYERLVEVAALYSGRLTIARNHSKIILANQAETNTWLVMESSANINTNPRIEQTCIHNSADLFDFYLDFFRGLRSIDRAQRPPC